MAKIKAIIFDFDGLLVNTQEMLTDSWSIILKRRGAKFDNGDNDFLIGTPPQFTIDFLFKKYKLNEDKEQFLKERRQITRELLENRLALMEGVVDLLKNAKRWKLKCAIGSSGHIDYIREVIRKFGIDEYFEVIVTFEDLKKGKGKPDPEVFEIAAKKLKVKAEECLVLEDAPVGIEAAKAAGMKAIHVPNAKLTSAKHDQADMILKSLKEVNLELINSLHK